MGDRLTDQVDRYVDVDGVRVRHRVSGTGPPVVLLHGVTRSLEDWTAQHTLLADRFEVHSLDLPGSGQSRPLRERHTVPALARAVLGYLDAVGVDRPIHLVGNSLGGAVAMTVTVLDRARVADLVLVASAGFGRQASHVLRVLALAPLRPLLTRPTRRSATYAERLLFHDRALADPQRVALALALARQPETVRATLETLQSLGGVRGARPYWRRVLLGALARLDVPTMVVWGDDDRILPTRQFDAVLGALPGARTHLFHGCGHLPQVECADEFAAVVSQFWASSSPTRPGT